MRSLTALLALPLLLCTLPCHASQYGATVSIPLYAKEPNPTHGYQAMLNYHPLTWNWRQFNFYVDGGFSRFWTPSPVNASLNIYSAAPVARYLFQHQGAIAPFIEASIGIAYLNRTRLEHRNLGIHMSFQDRLGIGALFGQSERFSLGLHAVHYSNAHLSSHNSGITIPLDLDVGYRF